LAPPGDNQPTVISQRPPSAPKSLSDSFAGSVEFFAEGDLVGHFRILRFIGGGGMGRVYRAWDTQLERAVALKVLPPQQAADTEIRLRFQNEARSAAKLTHEGFAQVYYLGEERGAPYIAFEFIEGTNLRDLVQEQGPLPVPTAISYTIQVAEALGHAASRGVVHRDIKPSNILVTREGRVKLIDLGLARIQVPDPNRADLTATGVTLGTFDYIAPEQARDPRSADQRSDIYSLGCTLYFLLTGQPPFPEGNALQKLLQHQGEEPPDVRKLRPDVPPALARVLRRMMAKEPRDRFQTAAAVVAALSAVAAEWTEDGAESGQITRPLNPALGPWSKVARHIPWLVPVAILILAVWLLNSYWGTGATEPSLLEPTLKPRNLRYEVEGPLGPQRTPSDNISLGRKAENPPSLPSDNLGDSYLPGRENLFDSGRIPPLLEGSRGYPEGFHRAFRPAIGNPGQSTEIPQVEPSALPGSAPSRSEVAPAPATFVSPGAGAAPAPGVSPPSGASATPAVPLPPGATGSSGVGGATAAGREVPAGESEKSPGSNASSASAGESTAEEAAAPLFLDSDLQGSSWYWDEPMSELAGESPRELGNETELTPGSDPPPAP